jgi:hypothetical protein
MHDVLIFPVPETGRPRPESWISGEAITIWLWTEAKEFFPICNISYIKPCGNVRVAGATGRA